LLRLFQEGAEHFRISIKTLPALHYIFAFLKKKSKGCRFDQGYRDYFRFHNDAKIGKLDSILELERP
jgi:hypothetical protein